jgi:hypothetical protein
VFRELQFQVVLRLPNQILHRCLEEVGNHNNGIKTSTRRFDKSRRVTSLLCWLEWLIALLREKENDKGYSIPRLILPPMRYKMRCWIHRWLTTVWNLISWTSIAQMRNGQTRLIYQILIDVNR